MARVRLPLGQVVVVMVGVALAGVVAFDADRGMVSARARYVETAHADALATRRRVDEALRSIYENLRTLSFLPSVRNIDRHGLNIGAEGRGTIQQIYNNLASNVAVSEVYVVPWDLDPDKVDPETGTTEAPILMFDELIVNAGAGLPGERASDSSDRKAHVLDNGPEEDESYEYRQFRDQSKWFQTHVPDQAAVPGLDVPALSGPEIITCDNTRFARTRSDADRMGVTFSVPFFGPDGKLKGSVTAIILSEALRKLLPEDNYALVNVGYGYASRPGQAGQERHSARWISAGMADPSLVYSELLPLGSMDSRSPWSLWVGKPDVDFYQGEDARSVRAFERLGYAAVALVVLAGSICCWLIRRNMTLARAANETLERRVAERTSEIQHMATHDGLTGLPNRILLRDRLGESLTRVNRGDRLALFCLDLDGFKAVNDTFGHPVGDLLLRAVAARLTGCLQGSDTVARLGGDEFVVLQPGIQGPDEAADLGRRLVEAVALPFDIEDQSIHVGCSIGIAFAPSDGNDADVLLRNADLALYRSKSEGRGTCRFFEVRMDERLQERRRLETDLRVALAKGEFSLHYQPIVDLRTDMVCGFEALMRWSHPVRGPVSPAEFIPLAEELGLIVPLGEWALRTACRDAAAWPRHVKVAVNLSPIQFTGRALHEVVANALAEAGLSPHRLELEITESVLLAKNETTLATLHRLRTSGVRIALDDFGTGYSSLSYLRVFPFDKIKIDQTFIREIAETGDCVAIVRAVASLGASLRMATTAEGVETAAQLQIVRAQGCTEVQGYLFSRALPVGELSKFFAQPDLLPKVA